MNMADNNSTKNGRGRPENKKYASVRALISLIKDKHRDWTPSEIRKGTYAELCRSLGKNHPELTEGEVRTRASAYLPSTSWIRDYLREIVNPKLDKPSPLETPWHMGTLQDYPLPAEAIPAIFAVQVWADKQAESRAGSDNPWLVFNDFVISIRQARHIAQLYQLASLNLQGRTSKATNEALYRLWSWSKVYALEGMISWLSSGTDFVDTSKIDKALREGWEAQVMGYNYYLYPPDEKAPGIEGGLSGWVDEWSADDTTSDVVKKFREAKNNERSHSSKV